MCEYGFDVDNLRSVVLLLRANGSRFDPAASVAIVRLPETVEDDCRAALIACDA
jgi:hypothetical protein